MTKQASAWNLGATWEDKKLKIDAIKKYLIDQKIVIGRDGKEA